MLFNLIMFGSWFCFITNKSFVFSANEGITRIDYT